MVATTLNFMNTQEIHLDQLKPNPNNPRQFPPAKLKKLKESIQQFPEMLQLRPIVVDEENMVLGGNMRLAALKQLGHSTTHVIQAQDLTDLQRRQFIIKDNLQYGEWDLDILQEEFDLQELSEWGLDEINGLLNKGNNHPVKNPDEPGADDPVISNPGDLFEFFLPDSPAVRHRLIHGDSTDPKAIRQLMNQEQAQLIFTDPPYGVSYETKTKETIQNDDIRDNELVNTLLAPAFKNMVTAAEDAAAFYIWHGSKTRQDFEVAMTAAALQEKQYIIWVKPWTCTQSDYNWQHEPCFYCQKQGHQARYIGDNRQQTVWELETAREGDSIAIEDGVKFTHPDGEELFVTSHMPNSKTTRHIRLQEGQPIQMTAKLNNGDIWRIRPDPQAKYIHPTQKPITLAQKAIANHLLKEDIVLDLFGGSGSTLIAAQTRHVRGYLCELDEKYIYRITRRFCQDFPDAVVMKNGEPFQLP